MLGMLAVSAFQGICLCIKAMGAERRSEFLVVKPSAQWVSDYVRFGNELDLDAEVERMPCHDDHVNVAFVNSFIYTYMSGTSRWALAATHKVRSLIICCPSHL
jgi:hypothetical protein